MGRISREPCPTCGKKIYSYEGWIEYEGRKYHLEHVPNEVFDSNDNDEDCDG